MILPFNFYILSSVTLWAQYRKRLEKEHTNVTKNFKKVSCDWLTNSCEFKENWLIQFTHKQNEEIELDDF